MKYLIPAGLALILTSGTVSAQPAVPGKCDVTVSFGSYAMGIDRPTFDKVERLLVRDRRVAKSDQQRWGREGEVTICAKARRRADIAPLFHRIKALFPRDPRSCTKRSPRSSRHRYIGHTTARRRHYELHITQRLDPQRRPQPVPGIGRPGTAGSDEEDTHERRGTVPREPPLTLALSPEGRGDWFTQVRALPARGPRSSVPSPLRGRGLG